VQRALVVAFMLALAGCGGVSVTAERGPANEQHRHVEGLGFALDAPANWSVRILVGAEGRPVLHAANFPLPSNDDDPGDEAQATIGSRGQMYVNVRDLRTGEAGSSLPLAFQPSDFGPPPPGPGSRCCFVTAASRDIGAKGHVYRVTVTSGSNEPPSAAALTPVNALLATLALEPYESAPVSAAEGGKHLSGYGIDLTLPPGWDGRLSAGVIEAASFELPQQVDPSGPFAGTSEDVLLRLLERGGSDPPYITARLPVRLAPTEFVPPQNGERAPALSSRSFVASGRQFLLTISAGSLLPSPTALVEANEALASLKIQPGDFYPGEVEPAIFASAPGWYTGTGGPGAVEPDGEQTTTWASTVAFRGDVYSTLSALGPDDIVISVLLFRTTLFESHLPVKEPPYRLDEFEILPGWEGQVDDVPEYRLWVRRGPQYNVDARVYFGRANPTDEQLERAQAELDGLHLPDWLSRP
jgi:hypothetical protein